MIIKPKRINWQIQVNIPDNIGVADFTPLSIRNQPNLNVVISTCKRENSYIHQLLSTMMLGSSSTLKINLVVSGQDSSYLDCYKHLPNIKIHTCSDSEWDVIKHLPSKFKASYNYIKCLMINDHENSLVFEDDVIFQYDWIRKFYTCLTDIENDGNSKYILSLFSFNKCNSQKNYFLVPKLSWAGTQAIYYPKSVLKDIEKYLLDVTNSVSRTQIEPSNPSFLHAYDMIIKEYCMLEDIKIYMPVESLIQHIGKVTAGGTGENIISSQVFYNSKNS